MDGIEYCLTREDMERCIPFECPIYHYSELKNFNDIFDFCHPNNSCILYFETERNGNMLGGHWTCLTLSPKSQSIDSNNDLTFSINFFDSYGLKPDYQKDKINDAQLEVSNMAENVLSRLLYDASDDINIEYNEKPLQLMSKKGSKKQVNTCGRHVICRIMCVDLPLDKYQKFMTLPGSTPDQKVLELTNPILKGELKASEVMNKLREMVMEMD